jgi:hypothetical protein
MVGGEEGFAIWEHEICSAGVSTGQIIIHLEVLNLSWCSLEEKDWKAETTVDWKEEL